MFTGRVNRILRNVELANDVYEASINEKKIKLLRKKKTPPIDTKAQGNE
jgi:hypothetical protein